jgi:hypothetical protein
MNKDVAIVFIAVGLWVGTIPAPVSAAEEKSDKEKSYYGTVIAIDRNANTVKLITNDGVVVDVAAEDKAAKHLDKIPMNTLIDMVVELRAGAPPLIKTWKMAQAQSPCRIFDGKMCTP